MLRLLKNLKGVIYMPKKKFNVALSSEEEIFLKSITHAGNGYSAREILHAQVLLS
jgi:hypothetical protein